MFFGRDAERVAEDARARMRRGPQPDHLRAEIDEPVVLVMCFVVESDVYGHKLGSVVSDYGVSRVFD